MERRPFTEEQNMFRESARAFFKSEICHLYKDERINRILAGSSEIMKEIIAREILDRGGEPRG